MRKLFPHFLLIPLILAGVGLFAIPQAAHATAVDTALSLLTGGFDVFYGLIGKIFWWVLIPLASNILALVGKIMDTALSFATNPSLYSNEAINIAWGVLRDIANMIFIFVLVYEGIRTILSLGNASKIKKTVTNVVIAALLLNFSLFFTKVFIDASNTGAAWFIQGVKNIGGQESVSSSIRATLQMEKLTATYGDAHLDRQSFSLQSFMQGILLFVLTCVAIYVLFKVADLIIGRIVAFIVLLITSPIGFTAIFLELGDVTTYAKKWWKEMTGQIFMLPMFFLMLYITLFLVDRFDKIFPSQNISAAGGFEPINYLMFIIIIMLLLRSLKIAEEYSGEIGNMLAKFTQQAVSVGVGGIAMGTLGKAATALQNNKGFQAWSAKSGAVGEAAMRATRNTASADFGVKSNFGNIAKTVGIDKAPLMPNAFKGSEKGYSGKIAQEVKDRKEYVKVLGKGRIGAENREVYAENLESGIYGRVVPKAARKTVGIVANDIKAGYSEIKKDIAAGYDITKAKIASAVPASTPIFSAAEAVGGAATVATKSTVGLAGKVVGGVFENQSIKIAKKDLEDDAAREKAKEVKKDIDTSLALIDDEMGDDETSIAEMQKELTQALVENTKSGNNLNTALKDELRTFFVDQRKLMRHLSTFKQDNNVYTIAGNSVSAEEFQTQKANTELELKNISDQVKVKSGGHDTERKVAELEEKIATREVAVKKQIERLKKAGISFKIKKRDASGKMVDINVPTTEQGLLEYRKDGEKVESQDMAKQFGEWISNSQTPPAPPEAPKADK